MASKQYAIGIDVGGTKILAGVVEVDSGKVLGTGRKRTRPEKGVDFFTDRLMTVVQDAIDASKLPNGGSLIAIGIGVAGQVDREHGILLSGPNLSVGMNNLPVSRLLENR